jgi:hypothetical protein
LLAQQGTGGLRGNRIEQTHGETPCQLGIEKIEEDLRVIDGRDGCDAQAEQASSLPPATGSIRVVQARPQQQQQQQQISYLLLLSTKFWQTGRLLKCSSHKD